MLLRQSSPDCSVSRSSSKTPKKNQKAQPVSDRLGFLHIEQSFHITDELGHDQLSCRRTRDGFTYNFSDRLGRVA